LAGRTQIATTQLQYVVPDRIARGAGLQLDQITSPKPGEIHVSSTLSANDPRQRAQMAAARAWMQNYVQNQLDFKDVNVYVAAAVEQR
jgi:hypothetical protein